MRYAYLTRGHHHLRKAENDREAAKPDEVVRVSTAAHGRPMVVAPSSCGAGRGRASLVYATQGTDPRRIPTQFGIMLKRGPAGLAARRENGERDRQDCTRFCFETYVARAPCCLGTGLELTADRAIPACPRERRDQWMIAIVRGQQMSPRARQASRLGAAKRRRAERWSRLVLQRACGWYGTPSPRGSVGSQASATCPSVCVADAMGSAVAIVWK